MKLAAVLILTFASSVAMAEYPVEYASHTKPAYDGLLLEYSARQPQQQVDGHDFLTWQRSGVAPTEHGFEADTDMDGNDWYRQPGHGADSQVSGTPDIVPTEVISLN